jgi:hypothetical protein
MLNVPKTDHAGRNLPPDVIAVLGPHNAATLARLHGCYDRHHATLDRLEAGIDRVLAGAEPKADAALLEDIERFDDATGPMDAQEATKHYNCHYCGQVTLEASEGDPQDHESCPICGLTPRQQRREYNRHERGTNA